jgi:hypothetical protein
VTTDTHEREEPSMSLTDLQAVATICCGRRLRWISIDGTHLVFTYCGQCESARWFADGLAVDPAGAIDLAGVIGRATKHRAPRTARLRA